MGRIEKTVFICYRRVDLPWALAVYKDLTSHGFDVFFDFMNINSGDFEEVILGNIKARAHFLVILTPHALERCANPEDWLRLEVQTALKTKRNIVPLMFEDFNFDEPSIAKSLTGGLADLRRYNALRMPSEYFDEAMDRLRDRFLNIPLEAVLQPLSRDVQHATQEQKIAAESAISKFLASPLIQEEISGEAQPKNLDSEKGLQPGPVFGSAQLVVPPHTTESSQFLQISEREFLDNVDLSQVRRLFVLGHTGRRIYDEIHVKLEHLIHSKENFPEEIRVITRTPLIEGLYRNNYIFNTLTKIKTLRLQGKNIELRFYEAVPSLRGIICESYKDTRVSYISSYHWPQSNNSKAYDYAYRIEDSIRSPRPEVSLLESWIEQYWGRDEIHTIVFDFDDTLVSTGEIQIRAWTQVIEDSLARGVIEARNLSNHLRGFVVDDGSVINKPALFDTVKAIFVDKQLAEAMIQDLFVDIPDSTIREINEKRFEIRESMMDQTRLYDGVEKFLKETHLHYNFAIISSTDEQMISDYLRQRGLLDYFPIILGKKDPSLKYERENIYNKTSLLIKLSEIIGIPLNRLVYIGDNNSDYLATRQLGIAFIEARQAARLMGKGSLIRDIVPNKPPIGFFETFEDDRLTSLLKRHSNELVKRKYQV